MHAGYGYKRSKMVVISNGYSFEFFKPDDAASATFREELDVGPDEPLLGMVGRFNIQKNHRGLLDALVLLKSRGCTARCVLVGTDINKSNESLLGWIKELGIEGQIILLDQRTDIPAVMSGLDIHLLTSSFGEGFPNVVAEAMACGTPCICTDVGDSRHIIGDTGCVVPINDPVALARAIEAAICEYKTKPEAWQMRREASIARIRDRYSLKRMIRAYQSTWEAVS